MASFEDEYIIRGYCGLSSGTQLMKVILLLCFPTISNHFLAVRDRSRTMLKEAERTSCPRQESRIPCQRQRIGHPYPPHLSCSCSLR